MRKLVLLAVLIFVSGFAHNARAEGRKEFSPTRGVSASIDIRGNAVMIGIVSKSRCSQQTIELDFDAENFAKIDIADYNFDGKVDFSVWHLDEGKGTYTIHRIFLYSQGKMTFLEYSPTCGDEFLNLKIDKKRRRLVGTYFERNEARICVSRPHPVE